MLRNVLHHLPTCFKITMDIYVFGDYDGYLESAIWNTLIHGLGAGKSRRPWGPHTRVGIRLRRGGSCPRFDQEPFLVALSRMRPVLSVERPTAVASVSSFFNGDLDEFREVIVEYHIREKSTLAMNSTSFNIMIRSLQIVRLEMDAYDVDLTAMWHCIAACRHSLASLALVDIQEDLSTMTWVHEAELFPALVYLKLFRLSADSAVRLLKKIVAPKLRSLEYETVNWDNAAFLFAGLMKTTLKVEGTLNPDLRRFVLHVATTSMSWSRVLPVLVKMQRCAEGLEHLKFELTYRGVIHFPLPANSGSVAFNTASAAGVWSPMTSMAVTLLLWCPVDWSRMAIAECNQLRYLMVVMPDSLPHGLNEAEELSMFTNFFKHFRAPNLQELHVHIPHEKFEPYLDVLFEVVKLLPDLRFLKLGVNDGNGFVNGRRIYDLNAYLPTFCRACSRLGIAVSRIPVQEGIGPR